MVCVCIHEKRGSLFKLLLLVHCVALEETLVTLHANAKSQPLLNEMFMGAPDGGPPKGPSAGQAQASREKARQDPTRGGPAAGKSMEPLEALDPAKLIAEAEATNTPLIEVIRQKRKAQEARSRK